MQKMAVMTLATTLLFGGAVFAQQSVPQGKPAGNAAVTAKLIDEEDVYEQLNLFEQAFERIRRDAVQHPGDEKLVAAAIGGMLSGLDPHSTYLDAAAYRAWQAAAGGAGDTLGLVVRFEQGALQVIAPRDGSPAAAAGLQPGDLIFSIDREPTFEMTPSEARAKLQGPPGSVVTLRLRRGEGKPLTVKVRRAAYRLESVSERVVAGDIGYIRIAGFDGGTKAALAAAVAAVRQGTGGKPIGLILDLRNNPGGGFDAAVAVADAFIDKGDIAIVKGRGAQAVKHIAATPGDVAQGLSIVVLVNGGTAREAELVAGALADDHRAVLLGTKTFGDASIESVIPLADGGAIRLTTARFETPSGGAIQGKGLTPGVEVAPLKLERLAQGDILREADLPGALKNPDDSPRAAAAPAAAASAPLPPVEPAAAGGNDEQLTHAIDVLRGFALVSARAER
jgi:carboxyl-terminal processing protease